MGRGWSAAQGLQPGHCPLEPIVCSIHAGEVKGSRLGRFGSGWAALSSPFCRWVFLDGRTDDGFSTTIFLIPLSLYFSQGRRWHFFLMTVLKEMPFCSASLVGRREEPTHSYQPRVFNRSSPTTLRSVPRYLEGEVGIARPMCVWDPGPRVGFGAMGEALGFPLHSLLLLGEGEAWVGFIPPFLCPPL